MGHSHCLAPIPVNLLLNPLIKVVALGPMLRNRGSKMNASMERLSAAESILLEYVEKYGLTHRARAYFQSLDAGLRNLPSVQESPPASDCCLGDHEATS